jgi:GGDEF domain-containing protein
LKPVGITRPDFSILGPKQAFATEPPVEYAGQNPNHGQSLGAITISLGVAVYPQHGADAEALLQAADAALYEAKHAGRDRVVAGNRANHVF